MQRPHLRAIFLSLFTFLAVTALVAPAFAEDKKTENAAKDALKKVEDDFLQGDYGKAIDKLKKAVDACGADKCTPATKAQLHRDLGSMYFYAKKKDDAVNAFVEALKIEPSAGLNINYKTPDVDAVYEDAKKKVPAGGGTKPPGGGGGGGGGGETGGQPSGDFAHEPAAEQAVRTPLPIYVTYAGTASIAKVVAKYKGFGESDFKQVELTKMGDGWGGLIPCKDVTQGTMQYYIQGFDASNDPVANTGTRNATFKVAIKDKIDGDAPHLPGASPPKQCQDTGDCPPDFPGCKKGGEGGGEASNKKEEGEDCEDDNQCKSEKCTRGKCASGEGEGGGSKQKFRRIWIGVAGSLDFVFLPSGDDVCKLDPKTAVPLNSGSYYCTNSDGSDYPFRTDKGVQNGNIVLGKSDQVKGGTALGNVRLMASLDYAINPNLLVGGRIGFTIAGSYPGQAAKDDGKAGLGIIHLEARGTYVIGKDPLMTGKFAPLVFVGAGASEFDSKVDVTVVENGTNGPKTVSAWVIGGPAFGVIGGGFRVGGPRGAFVLAGKISGAFGGSAGFLPVPGLEVGGQFGL